MESVLMVILAPFYFVMKAWQAFVYWVHTRAWPLLLWGLPALIIGPALAGIIVFEWTGADRDTLNRYRFAARDAVERDDRAGAHVLVPKLIELDPSNPETLYVSARLAEMEGDLTTAGERMRKLAPCNSTGHPSAHFWVAMRLLDQASSTGRVNTDVVRHHLEQALSCHYRRRDAHVHLARIHIGQGHHARAAEHLEAVVDARPELGLSLSLVYEATGDGYRARSERERAIDYLRDQLALDETNVRARTLLAQAIAIDGDSEQAADILLQGLLNHEDALLRQTLVDITSKPDDATILESLFQLDDPMAK